MSGQAIANAYTETILQNKIRTPDGTILQSWHRHDFKTYEDANGHTYMVDGGTAYMRRYLVEAAPYTELSVEYEVGNHAHNREHAYWGTYGKEGTDSLKRVLIKDLSNSHLRNILASCQGSMSGIYRIMMQAEQKHRGFKKVRTHASMDIRIKGDY